MEYIYNRSASMINKFIRNKYDNVNMFGGEETNETNKAIACILCLVAIIVVTLILLRIIRGCPRGEEEEESFYPDTKGMYVAAQKGADNTLLTSSGSTLSQSEYHVPGKALSEIYTTVEDDDSNELESK